MPSRGQTYASWQHPNSRPEAQTEHSLPGAGRNASQEDCKVVSVPPPYAPRGNAPRALPGPNPQPTPPERYHAERRDEGSSAHHDFAILLRRQLGNETWAWYPSTREGITVTNRELVGT